MSLEKSNLKPVEFLDGRAICSRCLTTLFIIYESSKDEVAFIECDKCGTDYALPSLVTV